MATHGPFPECEEVLPGEADGAGKGGGGRKETEEGERGRGLAGAGLADQAEGLARGDAERDVVHGEMGAEADVEVVDFEQGGH